IPAVVYGGGKDPINIIIDQKDVDVLVKVGTNTVIDLELSGGTEKVILKEIKYHVVDSSLLHADFQRISMDKKLDVSVPVRIIGEALGIKTHGAILDHSLREIKLRCLPTNIPHDIVIDVSALNIGETVKVSDVKVPSGVELTEEPLDKPIVHLIIPRGEEVEAPKEEGEAEPEVVEKGKKEKEGEEGEKAGKEAGKEKGKEPAKEKGKEQPKKEKK
ncbi:MAG TPA: 50S ribosomal protein L25, partial [Elusimicrobiales bacterium]|nr:50S ribosomal protein L25 [Elusimicrobiales bacterium]